MSGTTLSSSAFTSSSPSSTSASSPGALSRFWRLSYSDISSRLVEYRHFLNVDRSRNWSIMLARAGGQALNFTAMFVLLPMLRSATHSILHLSFFFRYFQINSIFLHFLLWWLEATQGLHQNLPPPLFKPNVQAQYYQIEAEGLQLSPSFGQVSTPPILNLGPQTYLSLSNCTIFIIQSTRNLAIPSCYCCRHVSVHRLTGYLIVFYSLIHTGAHLANLGKPFLWLVLIVPPIKTRDQVHQSVPCS